MSQASAGQTVRIHYTVKLESGTLVDTSVERDPMEFELGSGRVMTGLDSAVQGMTVGESKTVTLQADEAFGPHREQLVVSVPNNELPDKLQPSVGMQLESRAPDGKITKLTVTEVADNFVTLDANHPLAGKALQFDIQLVEIV
jgi:peptidylprolyl isomerase